MLFGKTIDRQLENRPQKIKFCTKCVVSNQRPRITFDEKGVCSACQYAYEKHHKIDWAEREKMLIDLLVKFIHFLVLNYLFSVIRSRSRW